MSYYELDITVTQGHDAHNYMWLCWGYTYSATVIYISLYESLIIHVELQPNGSPKNQTFTKKTKLYP